VERWSQLVVAVACADIDVPTLEDWGRLVRLSSRTLCSRCQAAGARPKDSLDLGRLLRVLRVGDPCNWHPEEYLDIIDPRTFARLLSRGGLDEVRDGVRPSVTQFLSRHRFDLPDVGIEAVRRRLRAGLTILA
jgi:hypothetical protein